MDYLICSSYEEGLSTVVIEALLLNIPVITTDCTGMREIFGNTQSGIICDNSKKGLLEAIRFVLNHPEKHDYYKEQAKNRGRVFYASERLKAVEEILDGPIN